MFRIKICGITTTKDAEQVARAGADAIGLNFYPGSPRFVSTEQARAIAAVVTDRVAKVGVFVNTDVDMMLDLAGTVGLDMIQLHGDEPPQTLQKLSEYPVLKAFRCRDDGLAPVRRFLNECGGTGRLPEAVLLDAYAPGKYGGTGRSIDWPAVRTARSAMGGVPVVLAGGLVAENVAQAIAEARPAAVDTAGGVETSPGVKDHDKIDRFVAAAVAAFRQVESHPE